LDANGEGEAAAETTGSDVAGEDDNDARRSRRTGGSGPTALLTVLKDGGFFASRRTIGDMKAALAAKGHTLKSTDLSPILVALTQQGVLKREKNSAKQWTYFVD
jgi:hypothetical protein